MKLRTEDKHAGSHDRELVLTMQKVSGMQEVNELQTLTADNLTTVHGGKDNPWGNDFASQVWGSVKESFHDWRTRTGQAFTDAATRNVGGAVTNSIAATADLNALPLKAAGALGLSVFK